MTVVHPLKAYRTRRKLSLSEMATEIGVKPNTVWRWEQGRLPHKDEWPKIEKATGIKAERLVRFAAGIAA